MFVATPPPITVVLDAATADQQADLDCLSLAYGLRSPPTALLNKGEADRMARIYLDRLKRSDPTKRWASLTASPSSIAFGWFVSRLGNCRARLEGLSRRPIKAADDTRASLWVLEDEAQLHVWVEDAPSGYRLVVDCVRGCRPRVRYSQNVDDTPISLFRLWDGDDLVYSVWSGGVAYRVRVWKVNHLGVSEVLEASSRGRPDFVSSADGAPQIRTYEADGAGPMQTVQWEYRAGGFSRLDGKLHW